MFDDVKKEHKVFSAHAEVVPARQELKKMGSVFSAHAEVVPSTRRHRGQCQCILRARGGSSDRPPHGKLWREYSPRTRR